MRTLNPMPAIAADRQRRISPAIQKQHGLLAFFQIFLQCFNQRRRQPRNTPGPFERLVFFQIQNSDFRQFRRGKTAAEPDLFILALINIVQRFQCRRRRRKNNRNLFKFAADDRHVAPLIIYGVFLLIG